MLRHSSQSTDTSPLLAVCQHIMCVRSLGDVAQPLQNFPPQSIHNRYAIKQVRFWRAYSRSAIGRCTLRTRLWLWILTLVFAGFTLHTSICACEVVHPHQGSTKPCIVRCHTTNRPEKSTAQLARQSAAIHPALLSLAIPRLARPVVVDALPRFTLENTAPLLARGQPPVLAA